MRLCEMLTVGACVLGAPSLVTGGEGKDFRQLPHNIPADVVELARRAIDCRTWSTTEITDAASDARVESALADLRCDALAADLDALRRKRAGSEPERKAIDALRDFAP